jgi:hypothetical protein
MSKSGLIKYEDKAMKELQLWQREMEKRVSITNRISKKIQNKINDLLPEKFHKVVTSIVRNMSKTVLYGSKYTSGKPLLNASLEERENLIKNKAEKYKTVGAASGAWIGSGGLLLALADLPVLLSIKMKLLFSIANLYGFNVKDYQERLFILYIFQLSFSSQAKRKEVYQKILNWEEHKKTLPQKIDDFEWRSFQQEYRDYIDIAKLLQLVPGIGAVVGAIANHRLIDRLAKYAMNAYRLRLIQSNKTMKGSGKIYLNQEKKIQQIELHQE